MNLPKSPREFTIRTCKFGDISPIFEKYHYKGKHMGGGVSFHLALLWGDMIVGGATVGKTRHDKKYSENGAKSVLEIRRLALLDECPHNSESYFLSKIIHHIKKTTDVDAVISYADMSVGHVGTIYKASNFRLIGHTAPSKHVFWNGVRYHPRSLTIDRPYSYVMREAIKTGEAILVTGEPKAIYWFDIKRKKGRG